MDEDTKAIYTIVMKGEKARMDALEHGLELERQGKHAEALPFFQEAVQNEPQSYSALTHLGEALNLQEKYTDALSAVDHALQINSQYAPAWSIRAQILYSRN